MKMILGAILLILYFLGCVLDEQTEYLDYDLKDDNKPNYTACATWCAGRVKVK